MDQQILDQAKSWATNPYFDENDRKELAGMLNQPELHAKELTERFYRDLEFGTGGLRNIIGFGKNRMNKYNVRKATQAMCQVALKTGQKNLRFALSFDSRTFSREFAEEACGVLAANGIEAILFPELRPTPMLSFSVRYHQCVGGIMITASHNPKAYNGFKAYWSDGGQVTPPTDSEIIKAYNSLNNWNDVKWIDFKTGLANGLIRYAEAAVETAYYENLKKWSLLPQMMKDKGEKLKVVYTPIHGTGLVPCSRYMHELGFTNFHVVEEQAKPDASFPTVKLPNPEYPEALKMATDLMIKLQADLAMGTDPDTDRLGVAVLHRGQVEYLNGNQIALLMLDYVLGQRKKQNKLPAHSYVIKSIVTSELQTAICRHYGVKLYNTLTGFKWMGALMTQLEQNHPEENYIFASEESFGYMPHNQVRDKDAVSSIGLMSEIALYHKLEKKTLIDALDALYEKFGFSLEGLLSLDYEGKEGAEKISRIMAKFRSWPANSIGDETIANIQDLENSPHFPKSNVLGFTFNSGNILWLRPSGTEPKIKFYYMANVSTGSLIDRKKLAKEKIESFEMLLKQICNEI